MYSSPMAILVWCSIFLVTALAVWKGGMAERIGALLNLATCLTASAAGQLMGPDASAVWVLVLDGLLAMGFLALAVRYASVWLGSAMILQAVQFSLHAFYLMDERPHDNLHARINNIDTFGILIAILVGAILAWRKRRRQEREAAEREAAASAS